MWPHRYPRISDAQFAELTRDARLVECAGSNEKVFFTPDGLVIKLTYLKRLFSSALLVPYATRFCRNARRLHSLGIRSVECRKIYYQPSRRRHLVIYPFMAGETLRTRLRAGEDPQQLLDGMARLFAKLHARGVYFRSTHFGNILIDARGAWSLIDIADMSISRHPLDVPHRARNFRHLLHSREDTRYLEQFGFERFLETYFSHSTLEGASQAKLRHRLRSTAAPFTKRAQS